MQDGFLWHRGTPWGCSNVWEHCPGLQRQYPGRETPGASGKARSQHAHGEDGGDLVEGGNEDANLADAGGEEQGPRGLAVGFPVAKDLRTEQAARGPETHGLLVSSLVLGTRAGEAGTP